LSQLLSFSFDLDVQGFQPLDRQLQFDVFPDQPKIVVCELFHAVSAVSRFFFQLVDGLRFMFDFPTVPVIFFFQSVAGW
jgi:hypothetical protein